MRMREVYIVSLINKLVTSLYDVLLRRCNFLNTFIYVTPNFNIVIVQLQFANSLCRLILNLNTE